ncbi:Uncharacterized protein APZ42_032005 [Daphnia magna]|uniref:Uncharacterized protein n=1 Tax=Daphnia magna TaxID=35525 RepID=A0A162DAJ3_9CRUS|nr:Uncharacterized protein APZ42_032005 [Daphnia magna]
MFFCFDLTRVRLSFVCERLVSLKLKLIRGCRFSVGVDSGNRCKPSKLHNTIRCFLLFFFRAEPTV